MTDLLDTALLVPCTLALVAGLRSLVPLVATLVMLAAIWGLSGCVGSTQLRALAAMTDAATVALPGLRAARDAEELGCLDGTPTYAEARRCVEGSRARWAPVWTAYDALLAVDSAAVDGGPDMAAALRAYCALADVTALPEPPGGECP